MEQITGTMTSVGFSSPPAWVLPYQVLSNGQRFRCDLARALLSPGYAGPGGICLVAFDEFTSVVDRQVGQFAAVAKTIRKGRVPCLRFVAVTCHYDVLDWLEPDWVLDMASCQLARGCLQRPPIRLEIHRPNHGRRRFWSMFERHHYLSSTVHKAARCYVAVWDGVPVAFIATLANTGRRAMRIVHRLVVLPDYQGMGIGTALLETVCDRERDAGYRMTIRTGHPAVIAALRNRDGWRAISVTRTTKRQSTYIHSARRPTRSVVSFERVTG
jgi:GNAT superfamily N-acetyltransferase